MDPLTAAGTFATIVGLLSNFKAESSSGDLSEFIQWLREQHQDALAAAISSNKQFEQALSTLLETNQEVLVKHLKLIKDQILSVAQKIDGFIPLVNLVKSTPSLSPQALSILKQIASSSANFVMEDKSYAGTNYLLIDGKEGQIFVDILDSLMKILKLLSIMNIYVLNIPVKAYDCSLLLVLVWT